MTAGSGGTEAGGAGGSEPNAMGGAAGTEGGTAGASGGGGAMGGGGGSGGLPPAPANGFARNPIVSHVFTADPAARVFEGRVYVYTSHDLDEQMGYDMTDYHAFSSDDLVNWQDHGVVLDAKDISWTDRLYAPDCCHSPVTGKYYLYFPNAGSGIGVAVSDSPAGPFVDAIGKPLIDSNTPGVGDVDWIFDPACFVDDDGQAYLYFGGGPPDTGNNARVIRLNDDMISLKDPSATTIPAPDFFEASYLHKYNGKYYFSYSTTFANHSAEIDYLVSDNPMTGFEYAGTILPNPEGNNGNNNHHSIVEYEGKWYIFYHNRVLSNRDGFSDYQRSIAIAPLTYDADGKIVQVPAAGGRVAQLKSVPAFFAGGSGDDGRPARRGGRFRPLRNGASRRGRGRSARWRLDRLLAARFRSGRHALSCAGGFGARHRRQHRAPRRGLRRVHRNTRGARGHVHRRVDRRLPGVDRRRV